MFGFTLSSLPSFASDSRPMTCKLNFAYASFFLITIYVELAPRCLRDLCNYMNKQTNNYHTYNYNNYHNTTRILLFKHIKEHNYNSDVYQCKTKYFGLFLLNHIQQVKCTQGLLNLFFIIGHMILALRHMLNFYLIGNAIY